MASNSKTIAGSAAILGNDILSTFKERVGDEWDNFLEKDRKAIERASKRFATLSFRKLKGEDVENDLNIIKAIIANYASVESGRIHRMFWESANEIVGLAGNFLSNVIAGQLA